MKKDSIIRLHFPETEVECERDIYLSYGDVESVAVIKRPSDQYVIELIVGGHSIKLERKTESEKDYILSQLGLDRV